MSSGPGSRAMTSWRRAITASNEGARMAGTVMTLETATARRLFPVERLMQTMEVQWNGCIPRRLRSS